MPVDSPEEIHAVFEDAFNSGDADALLALYERDAVFEAEPGQLVSGTDAIREVLGVFLAFQGTLTMHKKVVAAGDIALVKGSWSLTGTGPDGSEVNLSGESTEIVRRQADGTWLYVIDIPDDV
jgi:uncharacterized protein (TIGR02246 family)